MIFSSRAAWALLISTYAILVQAEDNPKSQVEQVPGLILPRTLNKICMYHKNYDCRWTDEKSCSCNPKPRKLRMLEVTFSREKRNRKTVKINSSRESDERQDRFIQMA